jgi:hypothetical protein
MRYSFAGGGPLFIECEMEIAGCVQQDRVDSELATALEGRPACGKLKAAGVQRTNDATSAQDSIREGALPVRAARLRGEHLAGPRAEDRHVR